jgi:hypothetical protein
MGSCHTELRGEIYSVVEGACPVDTGSGDDGGVSRLREDAGESL